MSQTKKLNPRNRSKIHSTRVVSLIAFLGLLAAVVVSVSVESRTGGRSGKAQPSDHSMAAARKSSADSRSTAARHTLDPGPRLASPPPPTVTATKTDALFSDLDSDGNADPGDTLRYTVIITATGADATGVQFADTLDPNTTFVAGTLMTTPLARNDSYSATGNVRISVPAPGVLANDSDPDGVGPAISATPGTFLSTQGGNVTLNANGSFTYNPPAGFEGNDSFTYTLNDNDSPNNTDTATVSITVSGMIWFIDNSASCPCDGRLTNPFNSINSFQSVNNGSGNNPAANDNIFIYESGSSYVGSFALLNGQKVIGQDATASLSSITGLTPSPESDPLPVTNSGNGTIVLIQSSGTSITVASGNTLTGFTGGSSVTDISGSGFGTLTISDVTLNGVGQGLDLSNGTLAATFGAISSTNSLITGITLTGVAGSLTSGSTIINNATGIGISVDTSSAALNFANTSVQGSGATGVSLTTNTGTIAFGSLDVAPAANQKALSATDNSNTITSTSGTISNSGATAIDISRTSGVTPLNISLTSVSSSGGTSDGISIQNTSGSFTINGDGSSTTVGGNGSGGAISNKSGADGSTSSGIGIYLKNAQNITLRRMTVNGTNQNFGIDGVAVNTFTMEYCTVNGTEGTNQAGSGEGGVYFFGLTGSASVFKSVFAGGAFDNFHLENKGNDVLNRIVFDTDTFNDTLNATSASALFMQADCASTLKMTIQNSTFTAARSNNANISIRGQSTDDLIVANNQFSNSNPNQVSGGSNLAIGAGGPSTGCTSNALSPTLTFNIHNNTFKDALGTAVSISKGGVGTGAFGTSANPGLVDSNVIGISGNSTSSGAGGISAVLVGGGQIVANITNNAIHGAINGINLAANSSVAGGGQGNFKAILQGNSVDTPNVGLGNLTTGLLAQFGAVSTDNPKVCLTLGGAGALKNNFSNAGQNGGADLRLRARFQTIIGVVGYGGANNDDSAMISFLASQNIIGSGGVIVTNNAATGSGWTGTCPSPGPALAPMDAAQSDVETSSASPASTSDDSDQSDTLRVPKGAKADKANGVKLTQSELNSMLQAAIQRWRESDASAEDLARLLALTFEVSDLPNGQLANISGTSVKIDEDAAGYGWFFDTTPSDDNEFAVRVADKELQTTETSAADGHIDLLTVLMRELGSQINHGKSLRGPAGWLMEPTLGTGTRRAPAFKMREVSKANSATPATRQAQPVRAATGDEQRSVTNQSVAAASTQRSARTLRNHATRPATSLADILLNIGTLPAGKSITITFNALVKDPFPGPGAAVCNQGTVSGSNFGDVLTDDPDVAGSANPTCTAIDLNADLEVTKSDSPDPVVAGTNLTYTINFTNHGPNSAGATVTDATPAGTTFVSASVTSGSGWSTTAPAVGNTGNVVFSKASTANGETAVFQMVVKVNSSVAGGSTINNSVTAATTGGVNDPVPANNTGTASTTVIAQADLSITKTDGAASAIPGTPIAYTITVTNNGPSDANGATVGDTFPGTLTGVTFTSVAAGGATGNTASGAGNINDMVNMPSGSSITYTVNATIQSSATGSLSNTATVTAPGGVTDPSTGNNSATDTDTLTPQADLSITKTDGATSEVPGTAVTYTITVTNSGPSDAPGATVNDTFPGTLTGVTFTSVAAGGATGNTASGAGNISDTLNMPSGSSVTYTVNANIQSSATGSLSNTATVTAPGGVTDPSTGNNSATDTDTLIPQADLSITKTDGVTSKVPGTGVTYTITVTNSGPSDAPGTTVNDNFPGILMGVSFTSIAAGGATGNTASGSGNISDTLNMPVGSSVTYTVNAVVSPSAVGSLSNTATVTAPGGVTDPSTGNNSATDTDTLTPMADVSVAKTDSPDPVVVGNNITYTITVTNNGPSDAQSLSLSDAVPANTTLVSVTTPAGWARTDAVPAGGTGTLSFTTPTLLASGSSVFTVVVNVNAGTANGTTISNTATASSATADPISGNNSATATTLVQALADLAISKTRSPNTASIDAGNNVMYTIQVINNGPAPASGATFSDSVPGGLEVVSQSNPAGWSCNTVPVGSNGTITCTKGTMANGETATLTVIAKVSCSDANGSTIMNNSSISAASPPDGMAGNNSSSTSFTVNNPAVIVTASVTLSQLPQNNHELINVGLAALASGGTMNCPPGPITVQVFGDEDDETDAGHNDVYSPDAKDIAVSTLRLRAERVDSGDGRVYLIVVRSGSSFATVTVVVPKSSSSAHVNAVLAEAAAAKAFADANNGAPPAGYFVIGDGAIIGNKQ